MGAELGLPADIPNHASYLHSWLRKLREDKREVFRAAAAAQRIADFCLAFHPDYRAHQPGDAVQETVEVAEPDRRLAA